MHGYRRPVHVVVVSGLSREAYRSGLDAGYLTAFDFLSNVGIVRRDCVAPFPSVTPTAIATIATGAPPSLHGVLGRSWYSRKNRAIHAFDPTAPAEAPAFDFLEDRLTEAACRVFTLNVPRACGGSGAGVGLGDRQVADLTSAIIREGRPDLTISVLRDLDAGGHAGGPGGMAASLARADRELGRILEAYGTWENAVAAARWLVVGDHGMSGIYGELASHVVEPSDLPVGPGALVVPNGRAAFVYLEDGAVAAAAGHTMEDRAEALSRHRSVDQVFWREASWTRARQQDITCSWRLGKGFLDVRGREWQMTGDPRTLGLDIAQGMLVETDYPDPMHRVDDLLDAADAPDLVVTARRGYEFVPRSGRASHGSLQSADSLVPLIAAGFYLVPHFPEARDVALLAMAALLPEESLAGRS